MLSYSAHGRFAFCCCWCYVAHVLYYGIAIETITKKSRRKHFEHHVHPVETLWKCRVSSFFFLFSCCCCCFCFQDIHTPTCGTGWFSTLVEKFSAIGKISLSPGRPVQHTTHVSAVNNFSARISFHLKSHPLWNLINLSFVHATRKSATPIFHLFVVFAMLMGFRLLFHTRRVKGKTPSSFQEMKNFRNLGVHTFCPVFGPCCFCVS